MQHRNISMGYSFPGSAQRCLMLGATVSPLHGAVSQTLCLVNISPVLP